MKEGDALVPMAPDKVADPQRYEERDELTDELENLKRGEKEIRTRLAKLEASGELGHSRYERRYSVAVGKFAKVSPHSNDFTTTHGGTISLFVSLTREPSEDTVVRFSVSTSDPATAYVEYGDLLVFTPENWDIGIPVLVRGVYQVGRSTAVGSVRWFTGAVREGTAAQCPGSCL